MNEKVEGMADSASAVLQHPAVLCHRLERDGYREFSECEKERFRRQQGCEGAERRREGRGAFHIRKLV